jgi:hypothetical protein
MFVSLNPRVFSVGITIFVIREVYYETKACLLRVSNIL